MAAMIRVLMLCFAYPPTGDVGLVRAWKFAKFLPEFACAPTVLTPVGVAGRISVPEDRAILPGVRVIRTPYTDAVSAWKARLGLTGSARDSQFAPSGPVGGPVNLGTESPPRRPWLAPGRVGRAVRLAVRAAITIPDEHVGWLAPGLAVARDLLNREPHDLIYSTSPPETAHVMAKRLKDEFGLPWVADLRDLWSGDHYRQRPWLKSRVLRWVERRTLSRADAIVTVSEPWRAALARDYEPSTGVVACVPNGFDADDYAGGIVPDPDVFRVVYTGSLDRRFQDPELVLRAVGRLVQTGQVDPSRFSLDFYLFGDNLPDLVGLSRRHGLEGVVRQLPALGYFESLRAQQAATLLLAIQWNSDAGKGNLPLKVFDYLGARRPILVAGSGEGVLGPLLDDTGAGWLAPTEHTLMATLFTLYEQFRASGGIQYPGAADQRNHYSRRTQARLLAAVFEAAIGARP